MKYRREIDGLRAVAVIPVILFHANFAEFSGGFVGVDVFFVISGYLITSIILEEREEDRFSLLAFYERRARRILPALYLVVLCCVPFALLWALPAELEAFARSVVAVIFFVSNFQFWRESGYFSAAADEFPLLHTWSLAVEEQFYIVFPIVLVILLRLPRRWLWLFLSLTALVSLAIAEWGWRQHSIANFYLAPTRAWELLLGSFCAFYLNHRRDRRTSDPLSLMGLALILYAVLAFERTTPTPSLYTLVPTLGAAMVILFCGPNSISYKILGTRALVGLGLISYSTYLWHQPLLAFARLRFSDPAPALKVALCLAAIALAYISWHMVETPFRNRQAVSIRRLLAIAVPTSFCLLLAATLIVHTGGFIDRYSPIDRKLASITPQSVSDYVNRRFEQLQLAAFSGSHKKKILIIGDSFAKDLVNALYESGIAEHFQISTYEISSRCGNLMLDIDLSEYVNPRDRARCSLNEGYADPELKVLMRQADVVWLSSSWKEWQSELLPRSVRAIQDSFDARVLVLSRKTLGMIEIRTLLQLSPEQRRALHNRIDAAVVADIRALARTLPPGVYVDVQELLCRDHIDCPVFNSELDLISFDGGHLTKGGAFMMGTKLATHPLVAEILGYTPNSRSEPAN